MIHNNPAAGSKAPATLPKTIEEATRRYLNHYHNNFVGQAAEMFRLKSMTHAFIYRLRKIAPHFYEEKLPTIVNQACSTLLLCDTNTKEGAEKFHRTHGIFLSILDEFKRSQPAGEVDYANEKKRHEVKQGLVKKQMELRRRLEELDAVEIDTDEIGEDDDLDSNYARIMAEKEATERDLAAVSMEITVIEGVKLEEEIEFELRVKPRSILNQLTKDELKRLEDLMLAFRKSHKDRTAIYCDISIIDDMFNQLNIAPGRFQKEQLRAMQKDALDAYRTFYRDIERADRDVYFDKLVRSKHLLPREGAILDPNDLPEDVRLQLDRNEQEGQHSLEGVLESFGSRAYNEKELGDELQDSGDEEIDQEAIVKERLRLKGIKFERVKEEPRDDCKPGEYMLEEEYVVDSETADAIVDNRLVSISNGETDYHGETDEDIDQKPRKLAKKEEYNSDGLVNSDERSNSYEEEEDDDDIECLGTVEPADKIKMYQLTEE